MTCLDDGEIAAFFEGRLETSRIDRLERHLDGCPACLSLLAAVAPALRGPGGEAPEPQPSLLRVDDVLAERYEIQKVLGAGATGYVYQARDRLVETVVALKVLRPRLADDPALVRAFVAELQLARRLTHPNVCRVFDMQQTEGHCFLTMELASRGSLRDEIRAGSTRALSEKVADAVALASGLAAMHAAGIVHRDLKPANLLRTEDGRLVLSDFGLARASGMFAPATDAVGTPTYIAPEVLAGDPASPRSDVWSLGVTLHELFFGAKPAAPGTPAASPRRSRESLESALERLCRDCLAERPGERPLDAAAVLDRLRRIQVQPARQRRRRWTAAALGLAGIAAATALIAGEPWVGPAPLVPAEIVPSISLGKARAKGEVSPAELKELDDAMEAGRPRLAEAPLYRLVARPPLFPGADDWMLEPEIERTAQGRWVRYRLRNGVGERIDLAMRGADGPLRNQLEGGPGRSHVHEELLLFAITASRQSWADRGTRSAAARAVLRSLTANRRDPDGVAPALALPTLELALKHDPGYLAAHTERALALARKALLPRETVSPQALREEEAKLASLAPSAPRVLAARCRLLETALALAPEPTDAELATALQLCNQAAETPGVGIEPQRSVGQLRALMCDPGAAVVSLRRALELPSPIQLDLLIDWGRLALREHWPHAAFLERLGRPLHVHVASFQRVRDPFSPSLPLVLGSAWLRLDWTDRASDHFRRALEQHPPLHSVKDTVVHAALARIDGRLPPRGRPAPRAPTAATLDDLTEMATDLPWTAHATAEMLSWTDPDKAAALLRALAPPATCRAAVERASLERAIDPTRALAPSLSACRSSAVWVQRCRAHLGKPAGVGDPLADVRP